MRWHREGLPENRSPGEYLGTRKEEGVFGSNSHCFLIYQKTMATIDGIDLQRLVCNSDFEPRWESYTLPELEPKEVRVKSELTAAKHGTEKGELMGQAIYKSVPYLADGNIFDRSKEVSQDPHQWREVGNVSVGTVIAVGTEVEDLREGDRVYGGRGFRTVHQGTGFEKLVDGLTPEAACCLDPAFFALGAVRDAQIRIGERVIIFGMGAIGLLAGQLGCRRLIITPGGEVPELSRAAQHDSIVDGLREACKYAEDGEVCLLLEPLSDRFLRSSAEGAQIVEEVGSSHVRLLFDMYHQQITEGNLTGHIKACLKSGTST